MEFFKFSFISFISLILFLIISCSSEIGNKKQSSSEKTITYDGIKCAVESNLSSPEDPLTFKWDKRGDDIKMYNIIINKDLADQSFDQLSDKSRLWMATLPPVVNQIEYGKKIGKTLIEPQPLMFGGAFSVILMGFDYSGAPDSKKAKWCVTDNFKNIPTFIIEEQKNEPFYKSYSDNFFRDPIGNSVSVVVLIGMILAIIFIGLNFNNTKNVKNRSLSTWLIPILCVLGLFVAGYLSFIEISQTKAVCGPVGDCNTVQESPYAVLFGILPVGVLGILGYIGILASWILQYFGPNFLRSLNAAAVWLMALFGTLFSIYLTFLEPFVIGATCMWCIASAIIITLLFILSTEPAKLAIKSLIK